MESVEEDKNEDDDDISNISDLKTPNSSLKHTPVSAKGSSMAKNNSTSSFDQKKPTPSLSNNAFVKN